jgi:hypothetical protein
LLQDTHPQFEVAADALVSGDLASLDDLLRQYPDLITARSARPHHATLLHYMAANGVEAVRQRTPPNAVAIARCLLDAGAEVDALADTYRGGSTETTLNLLVSSSHPYEAGLQRPLLEMLLDYGAAPNGVVDDGSPLITSLAFFALGAARLLAKRGARVDTIPAAAGLGDLSLVRQLLAEPTPGVDIPWLQLRDDRQANLDVAHTWASMFRHSEVADVLLEAGAHPGVRNQWGRAT